MDLTCNEVVNLSDTSSEGTFSNTAGGHNYVHKAIEDPALLTDRCLQILLNREDKHASGCSYFNTVQKEITPKMRKIVAEWVIEVRLYIIIYTQWYVLFVQSTCDLFSQHRNIRKQSISLTETYFM